MYKNSSKCTQNRVERQALNGGDSKRKRKREREPEGTRKREWEKGRGLKRKREQELELSDLMDQPLSMPVPKQLVRAQYHRSLVCCEVVEELKDGWIMLAHGHKLWMSRTDAPLPSVPMTQGHQLTVLVSDISRSFVYVTFRGVAKQRQRILKKEMRSLRSVATANAIWRGTVIRMDHQGAFVQFKEAVGLIHNANLGDSRRTGTLVVGARVEVTIVDIENDQISLCLHNVIGPKRQ